MFRKLPLFLLVLSLISSPLLASARSLQQKQNKPAKQKTEEVDAEEAQQRTIAISLVTTLADEAKTFKDQTRRAPTAPRHRDYRHAGRGRAG